MKHVLHLASWYPNKTELQEGDFIQRHLQTIALYQPVNVIYVVKDIKQIPPGHQVETAQQAGLPSRLMATNWLNLAPRIGAAFRLNENTVFRAGFGIFHDFNPPTQAGITPYIPSENFLPNQIVNGVPNYQFPNPFPANPLLISNAPPFRPETPIEVCATSGLFSM